MKLRHLIAFAALASMPALAQLPQATQLPRGALAPADVDFLRTADVANADEAILGARVGSRTKNPGVHSLADNVLKTHVKADDALRLLASAKSVDLPHERSPRGKAEADELVRQDVNVERLYVSGVIRDGNDLIMLYESALQSPDADIRKFADTMLGAIRDYTRQASDLWEREGWDRPPG